MNFYQLGCVSLYKVISFKEKEEWDSVLAQFKHKDVYFYHGYCYSYLNIEGGVPSLFYYEDEKGVKIGYTFIKRAIELPFWRDEDVYDIMTPYGYGGPLTENADEHSIKAFREAFSQYCLEENIVSEFIRFHPLLNNHHHLNEIVDIVSGRETIYIDLTLSEQELVSNYHKNHKRNLNKAIKNNLQFKMFTKETALKHVDAFYELYKETMDKLNASTYYYFSIEYVKMLLSELDGNAMIAAVFYDNQIISAALCICEAGSFLHYHLGCSQKEYLNMGSNIFLFHHISCWGKANGLHTFHLGGGLTDGDSLFQFKHRFNQNGKLTFHLGKKVHHTEMYEKLTAAWQNYYSQTPNINFFPAYRANPISHETLNIRSG